MKLHRSIAPALAVLACLSTAVPSAVAQSSGGCPPEISTTPRAGVPAKLTVQDLHVGMTLAEAEATLACKFPGFETVFPDGGYIVKTYETPVALKQFLTVSNFPPANRLAMPGNERVDLQAIGLPGKEVVHAIAHRKMYETASRPTKDALHSALLKKYGEPSEINDLYAFGKRYTWFYDVNGNQVTSSQYHKPGCMKATATKPTGVTSGFAATGCGVVLDILVKPARDNPQLADALTVNIVDSHGLASGVEALQGHFDKIENARRNAEAAEASSDIDL
ncbi:hypothetical protein WNY37_14615 [Henriciella sp. AS95]|uniref:hypothetical protein n=1 Tax=Henriciella sp. AS95 TaxID=3135782 RepID=UPI003171E603